METLYGLVLLSFVQNQVTHIVVAGGVFDPLRRAMRRRSEILGELVSCHLCFGTWVGLAMSAVWQVNWLPTADWWPLPVSWPILTVANGLLLAFLGRVWVELLGLAAEANARLRLTNEGARTDWHYTKGREDAHRSAPLELRR